MQKGLVLIIGLLLISSCYYFSSSLVYGQSSEGEHDHYREVIGTTSMKGWKYPNRTVRTVQNWKLKIYLKHKVDFTTFLTLEAISQTECGESLGLCKSKSDAGPFQINSSKGSYYRDSLEYLKRKDYNSLFAFQIRWTLDNKKRNEGFCQEAKTIEEYSKCYARVHNGNNDKTCAGREWKYCYSDRVRAMREKLKKYYEPKWNKIKDLYSGK